MIKTLEAQIGQFIAGFKRPMSRGIVVQEQDHLGDLPASLAFFFQNQHPHIRKLCAFMPKSRLSIILFIKFAPLSKAVVQESSPEQVCRL